MELIEEAIETHEAFGPPEHAWANIAPVSEHQNLQDMNEGVQIERDIDDEDLLANAEMIESAKCNPGSELLARYQVETNRELLEPSEYRRMMRSLNVKQAEIALYHRQWCEEAIVALK